MNREEIEKTRAGVLEDLKGSDNLLVTFGGIQQEIGIPVFEFFNSISNINCDKILIRDFNQAWYQKGIDEKINNISKLRSYLQDIITTNKYNHVCFLGNSMGGYASILFGSMLNIDSVISFAPQTFIDRMKRMWYNDTRWKEQINNVHSNSKKEKEYFDLKRFLKKNNNYKTDLFIYYSPDDLLDKKHAERMNVCNNVHLNSITEGGHSVVKTVRDSGKLIQLIDETFTR